MFNQKGQGPEETKSKEREMKDMKQERLETNTERNAFLEKLLSMQDPRTVDGVTYTTQEITRRIDAVRTKWDAYNPRNAETIQEVEKEVEECMQNIDDAYMNYLTKFMMAFTDRDANPDPKRVREFQEAEKAVLHHLSIMEMVADLLKMVTPKKEDESSGESSLKMEAEDKKEFEKCHISKEESEALSNRVDKLLGRAVEACKKPGTLSARIMADARELTNAYFEYRTLFSMESKKIWYESENKMTFLNARKKLNRCFTEMELTLRREVPMYGSKPRRLYVIEGELEAMTKWVNNLLKKINAGLEFGVEHAKVQEDMTRLNDAFAAYEELRAVAANEDDCTANDVLAYYDARLKLLAIIDETDSALFLMEAIRNNKKREAFVKNLEQLVLDDDDDDCSTYDPYDGCGCEDDEDDDEDDDDDEDEDFVCRGCLDKNCAFRDPYAEHCYAKMDEDEDEEDDDEDEDDDEEEEPAEDPYFIAFREKYVKPFDHPLVPASESKLYYTDVNGAQEEFEISEKAGQIDLLRIDRDNMEITRASDDIHWKFLQEESWFFHDGTDELLVYHEGRIFRTRRVSREWPSVAHLVATIQGDVLAVMEFHPELDGEQDENTMFAAILNNDGTVPERFKKMPWLAQDPWRGNTVRMCQWVFEYFRDINSLNQPGGVTRRNAFLDAIEKDEKLGQQLPAVFQFFREAYLEKTPSFQPDGPMSKQNEDVLHQLTGADIKGDRFTLVGAKRYNTLIAYLTPGELYDQFGRKRVQIGYHVPNENAYDDFEIQVRPLSGNSPNIVIKDSDVVRELTDYLQMIQDRLLAIKIAEEIDRVNHSRIASPIVSGVRSPLVFLVEDSMGMTVIMVRQSTNPDCPAAIKTNFLCDPNDLPGGERGAHAYIDLDILGGYINDRSK